MVTLRFFQSFNQPMLSIRMTKKGKVISDWFINITMVNQVVAYSHRNN